jgi:hypothetical protein
MLGTAYPLLVYLQAARVPRGTVHSIKPGTSFPASPNVAWSHMSLNVGAVLDFLLYS